MKTLTSNYIFNIDIDSLTPKYLQLVECVIEGIQSGQLKFGEQIPSINEVRLKCKVSRDTVERAYNVLKSKKIVITTQGKGNYINKTSKNSRGNILFLLNKLSPYKMLIYNSFVSEMGGGVKVDLNLYHGSIDLFLKILQNSLASYDYFVVAPHFSNDSLDPLEGEIKKILEKIPDNKLVIIDNHLPSLIGEVGVIYQDFEFDIYGALKEGLLLLQKYTKLILVFPDEKINSYPQAIKNGFNLFCDEFGFDFEILEKIYPDMELQSNDVYILIEESDLVELLKQIKAQNIRLGQDLGIISYSDSPLKELLGITVMSTDFKAMGETAAYMILKNKKETVKNAFPFINRCSL
jgi:DNA-binding transcriptional regulator YhcF (GntR family)